MGIRIDRVYTKTGDQGTTGLVGGKRIGKDHLRIEAYGTVDELNAVLGVCLAHIHVMPGPKDLRPELEGEFARIQQDLFNMGADLATPLEEGKKSPPAKLSKDRIEHLEGSMDRWQENLAPLTSFVLPGGSFVSANLHFARTVCRRAERLVVGLVKQEEILGPALIYLNRLSDYFFVVSRYVAMRLGEEEILWKY